ncbi:hypothetical protein [Kitasatospora sp. MAP5-34]|uniref:hypothetical protein n=1 Tax=Kitasatospora sp. MAP5-34 TaxID=3035102 RepID=UPI002473A16D|nr:hypothetical protein [Kitasatospora sp. MAP5-34]MDH6575971.1 hypothetical protein [Kitasatospora sp. MAP5-34]
MAEVFGEELREQFAQARQALAAARTVGDDAGAQAYGGRMSALRRIAVRHGIELPHAPEEDEGGN